MQINKTLGQLLCNAEDFCGRRYSTLKEGSHDDSDDTEIPQFYVQTMYDVSESVANN